MSTPKRINEKDMTLGMDWNGYTDVRGWYVSDQQGSRVSVAIP